MHKGIALVFSVVHKSSINKIGLYTFPYFGIGSYHTGLHLPRPKPFFKKIPCLKIFQTHWSKLCKKVNFNSCLQNSFKKYNLSRKFLLSSIAFFGPNAALFGNLSNANKKFEPELLGNLEAKKSCKVKQPKFIVQILYWIYESIRIVLRALRLGLTFIPIGLLYPVTYFGSTAREFWWMLLLEAIEISGPIFIKFGQWASTRRDLFPEVCCHNFSRLQRRTNPHSYSYTKLVLKKAFGKNWRRVFVKFDNNKEPIGSGCVAQVYKVWICPDEVENKEIIEEILQEEEEETVLNVADGFRNIFKSRKAEAREEEEVLAEWRRKRQVKNDDRIENDKRNISLSQAGPNIQEIALNLAQKLVCFKKENNESLINDLMVSTSVEVFEKTDNEENSLEHSLVKEWQHGVENLDKSLPVSEDHPDDLEGLIPVAVKVLHPSIYRVFRRDIFIFKCCAVFISAIYPPLRWLSLEQCVDEFFHTMSAQLDLRIEADNMEKFADAFADVDCIKFPRPLRPFVSRSVLTETFEDGEPMSSFILDEDKCEGVKKNLAQIGVDSLIKMVFVDNFIHGDLHPGNMVVQNYDPSTESGDSDGNHSKIMMVDVGSDIFVVDVQPDPKPLRICMLDCGIVATLKKKDLDSIKGVFKHVCLGDGDAVADLFLVNSEHDCKDPDIFRQDMSKLVSEARENSISLGQVDVGVLLQNVLGLLLKHHVRLESAFSAVVLAVFVLEGLGRSLDPEMDILERARPVLVSSPKTGLWRFGHSN